MEFEYKDEIKNLLLSMSFDERLPSGSWVGYGPLIGTKNFVPASASINLTCVRNQTITQGSGSFQVNGVDIKFTGSVFTNTPTLIHINTASFSGNTLQDYIVTASRTFNYYGWENGGVSPYNNFYKWGALAALNTSSATIPTTFDLYTPYCFVTGSNNFTYISCSLIGSTVEYSSPGIRYTGSSASGSVPGVPSTTEGENVTTGVAALQIFVPSASYVEFNTRESASLASLVNDYTNVVWSGSDNLISSQLIIAPGEIFPYACDASCYFGEYPWASFIGGPIFSATFQNPINRQTTRAIKGGVSIASTSQTPPYGPGGRGTMGLVCQDSASGALVGLTNNHVVVKNPFYTDQQNTTGLIQNEYDLLDSSNTVQGDFVYQTGESQPVNPGGPLEIGRVLRYVPLYTSASTAANNTLVNNSDAAIFSLYCTASNGDTIIDFTSSFQQVGLTYTASMPFASTAEINNLLSTNPEMYSSGRTTGAKGSPNTLCPIRVISVGVNTNVGYNLQGNQTLAFMQDLIAFVKPFDSSSYSPPAAGASVTVCPYPAWAGDSGSTLIANIGGVWKIVGLVFAGNGVPYNPPVTGLNYEVASTMGYACRIDHVASQLGIKAWTGSIAPVVDNDSITYVTVSGSNDTKILNCSGSDYWQVGLTEKHNFC